MYKIVACDSKEDWLKVRKSGLTGTEVGAIMGTSPYMTPLDVFNNKIYGTEPQFDSGQQERMYWGRQLEEVVVREFFSRLGRNVVKHFLQPYTILQSVGTYFMLGTPDSMFDSDEGLEVLEVKTTGYDGKDWGEEGSNDFPLHYKIQLAWYVMIAGAVRGHLAVLISGQKFRHYFYERDSELENKMLQAATDFWRNNVQLGLPPMPVSEEDLKNLYPKADPEKTTTASKDTAKALRELKSVKNDISALEAKKKALEYEIKYAIGDAAVMLDEANNELATYKNVSRSSFDSTSLKADHPDTYAKYLKQSVSRTFTLKNKNID